MARHYSVKGFFQQTPNALLARYFAARGLFADLDFGAMKEGKPDELFDGWMALPDEDRRRTDADFPDIDDTSNEKGWSSDVAEMVLNQIIGGVRGVYNRAEYETRRREILQFWADEIEQLITTGTLMLARFKRGAWSSKPRLSLQGEDRVPLPGWRGSCSRGRT